MTKEEWRIIPGSNNQYSVSSKGSVRNNYKGTLLTPRPNNRGTLVVMLRGHIQSKKTITSLLREAGFIND